MARIPPAVAEFLDAVYAEPEALDTAESFARYHHDDVAGLTLDQLDAERILARIRWAVVIQAGRRPSEWLAGRLWSLDQAAARLRPTRRR